MKPLPIVLIFSGYILVYAAVAAGGKFATEPWAGLFYDAYTEQQSTVTPAFQSHPVMPIPKGVINPSLPGSRATRRRPVVPGAAYGGK